MFCIVTEAPFLTSAIRRRRKSSESSSWAVQNSALGRVAPTLNDMFASPAFTRYHRRQFRCVLGHAEGVEVLHGQSHTHLVLERLADLGGATCTRVPPPPSRPVPLNPLVGRGAVVALRLRAAQAPAASSAAPAVAVLARPEEAAGRPRVPLRRWDGAWQRPVNSSILEPALRTFSVHARIAASRLPSPPSTPPRPPPTPNCSASFRPGPRESPARRAQMPRCTATPPQRRRRQRRESWPRLGSVCPASLLKTPKCP